MAGIDYLKRRAGIDPDKIGLIGHSEGAMVAQMVAAESPDVAFTVLMAGPGIRVVDLYEFQRRAVLTAEGVPEEQIAVKVEWSGRMEQVALQEQDNATAAAAIRQMYAELGEEEKAVLGWSGRRRSGTGQRRLSVPFPSGRPGGDPEAVAALGRRGSSQIQTWVSSETPPSQSRSASPRCTEPAW